MLPPSDRDGRMQTRAFKAAAAVRLYAVHGLLCKRNLAQRSERRERSAGFVRLFTRSALERRSDRWHLSTGSVLRR